MIILRFLMLVCRDNVPVNAPAVMEDDVDRWVEEMDGKGLRVTGDPLAAAADARVVRIRDDRLDVTDGPFLGTEALLGFDLLECRDMEEAIEVASAHPLAKSFVLEVHGVASLD